MENIELRVLEIADASYCNDFTAVICEVSGVSKIADLRGRRIAPSDLSG